MIAKMPTSKKFSTLTKYMGEEEQVYKARMARATKKYLEEHPDKPINAAYIALSAIYRYEAQKVVTKRLAKALPEKTTPEILKGLVESEYGIKTLNIKLVEEVAKEVWE